MARPGPAEILSWAGPVMPNFISIRIFERFFKEHLNFIINSFQIKHCSFNEMVEYPRNHRGILAKNGPARLAEILGLNGPAEIPLKFAARPYLSSLRFTTLVVNIVQIFI